jgi:hypothetical protein
MNILQQEDLVKGMPDQQLMQEAQSPSGQFPQFLTISEIGRRTKMRKEAEARQGQPQGTVAEQTLAEAQEGIMGTVPQMVNPQNAGPAPQQPPPFQGPQPQQGMAAGGQVQRYAVGGATQRAQPFDPNAIDPVMAARIAAGVRHLAPETGAAAAGLGVGGAGGGWGTPPAGFTEGYNRLMNTFSPTAEQAQNAPLTATDALGAGVAALPEVPGILGNAAWDATAGKHRQMDIDAGREPFFGPEPSTWWDGTRGEPTPAEEPMFPGSEIAGGIAGAPEEGATDPAVAATIAVADQTGNIGTEGAGAANVRGAGAEVQSLSAQARLEKLIGQRPDLPDFQDMIDAQKKQTYGAALTQLGAGIAGGDLSGGLAKAGEAATAGNQLAAKLELESKLGQYESEVSGLERDIGALSKMADLDVQEKRALVQQAIQNAETKNVGLNNATKIFIEMLGDNPWEEPADRAARAQQLANQIFTPEQLQTFGSDFAKKVAAVPSSTVGYAAAALKRGTPKEKVIARMREINATPEEINAVQRM